MLSSSSNVSLPCVVLRSQASVSFWSTLEICLLALLTASIILGNSLVVLAVLWFGSLRTVAGLLVASLAVADLSVGLLVLPFSTVNQALDVWIFGRVWCQLWLAIDVWMCTASIYNLIAIAVDRYVAITRPLSYKSLATHGRAMGTICVVWTSSFAVCLPPMIVNSPPSSVNDDTQYEKCRCTPMTNSPGYIIFSSIGSFYLPFALIMFFYYRIYYKVKQSSDRLTKGYVSVSKIRCRANSQTVTTSAIATQRLSTSSAFSIRNSKIGRLNKIAHKQPTLIPQSPSQTHSCDYANLRIHRGGYMPEKQSETKDNFLKASNHSGPGILVNSRAKRDSTERTKKQNRASPSKTALSITPSLSTTTRSKFQMKKFNDEVKAMKTVGLVTVCFMACWLGFSVIYTWQAFCLGQQCTSGTVFAVFFWLGYANSALNPIIYAAYNKKYRNAFKKIVQCRLLGRQIFHRTSTDNVATNVRLEQTTHSESPSHG